jgi:hypothetical protein
VSRDAEVQAGLFAAEEAANARAALVAQLVDLAQFLALRAGDAGITVANLRVAAVQRGLIPQQGDERELSFLGAVMKRAGLENTGRKRRSHVAGAHGNLNTVWIRPGHA